MTYRRFNIALLAGLGLSLLGAWLLRPDLAGHGLHAAYRNGPARVERVALLTSNDVEVGDGRAPAVRWTGYLFLAEDRPVVFRIPAGAPARLTVGDEVVFDTVAGGQPAGRSAPARPSPGFNPISFEVTAPASAAPYFEAGLEWRTPLGWQLVPAAYLHPEPSDPGLAARTLLRGRWSSALGWLGLLCALGLGAGWLWTQRKAFMTRTALGLALVVALALSLRLGFLIDYVALANADVLGVGTDHRGYQAGGLGMLRGTWPPDEAFYVQPGMSLALGLLYGAFGPNIRAVQLVQMVCGALATLLVYDVARRSYDARAGWAAAVLWATFPLPIFYEATLLTHGLEAPAGALLIWLWLRALDSRSHAAGAWWAWVPALGLALGAASVLRPTFLILAPFMAVSLAWPHRADWRSALAAVVVLAAATMLPIAPVTWHNYQAAGRFQLLTSNSDITMYLGNNRDSTGLGEYSPAYWATHTLVNRGETTYFRQTVADIQEDPRRWAQLMLRKTALYLGDPELPNNVDFYSEGTAISPLLAVLPLRFGAMMALAAAGAVLALGPPRRRYAWLVVVYAVTQIGVTVAYHVFSRFRAPVYPALAVMAGWAAASLLRRLGRRQWRAVAVAVAILAASGAFTALMPAFAEKVMDRPVVASLPPGAIRLDAPIGESLRLVGHDPLRPVEPGQPLFVILYWQAEGPIPGDVYGTVQLFGGPGGSQKIAQGDQPIGTGSFPDYPTSQWRPGQIVRDPYYLTIPDDAPAPLALTVLAAAYDRGTGRRFGETTFGPLPLTRAEPLAPPPEAQSVGALVGSATLAAYRYAIDADRTTLTLTLYWRAGEPMTEDAVVFVHLFDSEGKFRFGQDTRPRGGQYSTLAWQPGEGIVDEHRLSLPPDVPPGEYSIRVGMYDSTTQNRLEVFGADGQAAVDRAVRLGTFVRP